MMMKFTIILVLNTAHGLFWLWVYLRLDSSDLARRIWEKTWIRWTTWHDRRWVLIYGLGSLLFSLFLLYVAFFPEHQTPGGMTRR
jgi:hypothetical protein